jgi:hypothetical protein
LGQSGCYVPPNCLPRHPKEPRRILADAIREAYSDLFAVNLKANELSVEDVKNKFRTLTQGQNSENVLGWMAKTFKALADLADWSGSAQVA